MVDFNQPEMYAKSSGDLEQYSAMEARYNLLEAFEQAEERGFQGTETPLHVVKARLFRLTRHVYDEFKRNNKKRDLEGYKKEVREANSLEKLDELFRELDEFLDDLGINRMDRESLGGNIVKRNKASGL